ncbi:MAG TPA: hypothetical protein VHE54_12090 [Puia sp.]|nr:hypothetical protein [Puia sp.]
MKEPDYAKYLAYGKLNIDLEPHASKDGTHAERTFTIICLETAAASLGDAHTIGIHSWPFCEKFSLMPGFIR